MIISMYLLEQIKAKKFYYNNLFYDYIFNYEKLSDSFFYNYKKPEDYFKHAEYITSNYKSSQREKLAIALLDYNTKLGCSRKTIENINYLKNDAFTVIAGQQPGFLTGPLFIIFKAISVIKLSKILSDMLCKKVIPLFWNASDDSNISQINNVFIFKQNTVNHFEIDFTEQKRFSDIALNIEFIKNKIEDFLLELPKTDFTDTIKLFFENLISELSIKLCNKININIKNEQGNISPNIFFSKILLKLFSSEGLVIVDPSIELIKELALETVFFDLENSENIKKKITKQSQKLSIKGYHNQIKISEKTLNFFITENGFRNKIYIYDKYDKKNDYNYENNYDNDSSNSYDKFKLNNKINNCISNKTNDKIGKIFIYKDSYFSKDQLVDLIQKNVRAVSLNVLLRAVLQDKIFPNLCTICGPGEVSYFAQFKDVYDLFKMKCSIVYPRFSATFIEKSVEKSIKRLNINLEDLDLSYDNLKKQLFKENVGSDVENVLQNFEIEVLSKVESLRKYLTNNDIYVGSSFNRINENFKKEIKKLKNKIMNEHLLKNELLKKDLDKIYLNVFPLNNTQEKIINIFYFINKYGFDLIENLLKLVNFDNNYHKFIYL